MAEYIKSSTFVDICKECDYDDRRIRDCIRELDPKAEPKLSSIRNRIANYRRRGLLPLPSGNSIAVGEILKGTSTLYDDTGNIKQQWVKSDVPKEQHLEAIKEAIKEMTSSIQPLPLIQPPPLPTNKDLATIYISNDIHFGALMWDKESGEDWNLEKASETLKAAYDHLFSCSPDSKVGIVCDLGDLLEVDNDKNMTPKSGNILSTDSRFPKILRAAYEALIYAVNKALKKHEIVYFYNIVGNHDLNAGIAIREVIRMHFLDNPRVIVDDTPTPIKYHHHDQVLLQFAHGDGLKMKDAGEVMASDNEALFSSTKYRFAHFGHTHKDAVFDGRLCRAESHRNLAPLNAWAHHAGYRRSPGTMKSITYHSKKGEISRNLFTL